MKSKRGIGLIALIVIIVLILIGGGTTIVFLTKQSNKENNIRETNNITEDKNTNNYENTEIKREDVNIEQIKTDKYAMISGKNKLGICVPQSYISNNIISVNRNKNEKIIITNATNFIADGIGDLPEFIYIEDEEKEVFVEIGFYNPQSLVVQEKVNDTYIYVVESNDPEDVAKLDRTRYILLDGIPAQKTVTHKMYNCYIKLDPTYEIKNEEVLNIAQNIEVLTDRGEFAKSGEKNAKLIINNEDDLVKKIGNVTFDFRNVDIYKWLISTKTGVGNNIITYYAEQGDKTTKAKVELPIGSNGKTKSLSDLRSSVEESKNKGSYPQELIELDIDGNTFYAVSQTAGETKVIEYVYMELEGDMLVSFYSFVLTDDIEEVKTFIKDRVLNKILFID